MSSFELLDTIHSRCASCAKTEAARLAMIEASRIGTAMWRADEMQARTRPSYVVVAGRGLHTQTGSIILLRRVFLARRVRRADANHIRRFHRCCE